MSKYDEQSDLSASVRHKNYNYPEFPEWIKKSPLLIDMGYNIKVFYDTIPDKYKQYIRDLQNPSYVVMILDYLQFEVIPSEVLSCICKIDRLEDFQDLGIYKEVVDFICDFNNNDTASSFLNKAAFKGKIYWMEFAYIQGFKFDSPEICKEAVRGGHLQCLKYAHEKGSTLSKYLCLLAAKWGHFECLKYAHQNGCPLYDFEVEDVGNETTPGGLYYSTCLEIAASTGNYDIFKYVYEDQDFEYEADHLVCEILAEHGHFELLKYAHQNGHCSWDETACVTAAKHGHFDILKYLHENGCPWSSEIFEISIEKNEHQILKYALDNGCPIRTHWWDEYNDKYESIQHRIADLDFDDEYYHDE